MRKNDFFGRQSTCAPELRGRRGLTSVRREKSRVPFPCRGRFTAVGPDMGKALGHRFLFEHDSFMSAWNERHLGSGGCRRDRRKKVMGRWSSVRGLPPHNLFFARADIAERTQVACSEIKRLMLSGEYSRQGTCAPELRGRRGLTSANNWEPSPFGGGRTGGVRTACPFRPVGRMGHTGCGPYGWGGGGIVSTVGNFVHKFDNFAVVFGCKK